MCTVGIVKIETWKRTGCPWNPLMVNTRTAEAMATLVALVPGIGSPPMPGKNTASRRSSPSGLQGVPPLTPVSKNFQHAQPSCDPSGYSTAAAAAAAAAEPSLFQHPRLIGHGDAALWNTMVMVIQTRYYVCVVLSRGPLERKWGQSTQTHKSDKGGRLTRKYGQDCKLPKKNWTTKARL